MKEPLLIELDSARRALAPEQFRRDVLLGLSRPTKRLPCKYFYDEQGARLFEAIGQLLEYYPTRTELKILRRHAPEIASLAGPACNLVDLGSGNGAKALLLLEELEQPASYMPIDVAREQLLECALQCAQLYPQVEVLPLCADYTQPLPLAQSSADSGQTLFFFPGSTIGNFEPAEAVAFLRRIARWCGEQGGLLLGVDLKKDPWLLYPAYNDSQGITAQFNLNLLARANRELAADFVLSQFRHCAFYNAEPGRIEMHLVSQCRQTVRLDGHAFSFVKGESILTEYSYKYHLEELRLLAAQAGFELARSWTDEQQWFSVNYLRPRT